MTKLFFCFLLASSYIYSSNFALHLKIDGGINPASQSYIEQGLKAAKKEGASFLLIQLNTPGGLLNSTRKIVESILESKLPVIVYIAPSGARAGSAGVMITLASHIAVMAPATNIGAAHPVAATGKEINKSPMMSMTSTLNA